MYLYMYLSKVFFLAGLVLILKDRIHLWAVKAKNVHVPVFVVLLLC